MDLLGVVINAVVVSAGGFALWWAFHGRFGAIESRFEGIEARIDRMEDRFDKRFDRLEASMDAVRSDLTAVALAVGARRTSPRATSS